MNKACYCNSDISFNECCEPIIQQLTLAKTAEQLMRSRFSAFYCHQDTWISASWDKTTRPASVQFEEHLQWLDLKIINTTNIDHLNATVEFEARYIKSAKVHAIHENSRFIKRENQWFYVDGDYLKTSFKPFKLGRNDSCPCSSELKYKNCCGQ